MERASLSSGYRLSISDRRSIENGCRAGFTFTAIAVLIGKSVPTVSREVGGVPGRDSYRADLAQLRAEEQARRPKQTKLEVSPGLRDRVEAGLEAYLSPEQVAGQLRREFPTDPEMQVHHETIYRELFVQDVARCALSCTNACAADAPAGSPAPRRAAGAARAAGVFRR